MSLVRHGAAVTKPPLKQPKIITQKDTRKAPHNAINQISRTLS
jgi:hypothetical protein